MADRVINVPLTDEQKSWLAGRAKENGRAVGREAQRIIDAERVREQKRRR